MPTEENKNIEHQLTNALDNSNDKQVENIIEQNPVETSKILPENSPLQKEAEEVVDGDKRTDEVDNEAIEDSIKDYHTPGGFLNQNQNGKLTENNERISDDFETVDDLYNYLIDWDKVDVSKPKEDHSEWENEPDFDTSEWTTDMGENPLPEGERPNFHEGDEAIDKMQERLDRDEDFAGPDELPATYEQIVEPEKELALTNDNELDSVDDNELAFIKDARNAGFSWEVIDDQIDDAVDNDETIPEEEKEETKKRRHSIVKQLMSKGKLLSGNSKSITGGSNVPSKDTDASVSQSSSNIQSAGKNILGNIGASSGITSSKIPSVKEEKKPAAAGSTASKAGGGSMPVANEGKYAAVSHSNGGNMASGSAGSGMFGKVGTLGKGGAITSKKTNLPSGESKDGSSVLKLPQGAKNISTDMNIQSLRDKIIAKSKAWPGQKLDKDGLLIVVNDDNKVSINGQLFENFIKDNPKSVQQLRQVVDKY